MGARLADFATQWRSLLDTCCATGFVEDGVGITFHRRPQLTHQCISFHARNSRQDLQQAVDALLLKGALERLTNVTSLGYYSQLFLVPEEDRRCSSSDGPFHSQSPHGSSTVQDGDTGIRPFSHQKSRVDSVLRHPQRLSTCPDASRCLEVYRICVQQASLPFNFSALRIGSLASSSSCYARSCC